MKVLIGIPTSSIKNYCLTEFIKSVANFTYTNISIFISDNTRDKKLRKKNKERIVNLYRLHSKKPKEKIPIIFDSEDYWTKSNRIEDVVCLSHEAIRKHFLSRDYDYLLHLESDIIAPPTIIEDLLVHKKQIVGAKYLIGFNEGTKLMAQFEEEDKIGFSSNHYKIDAGISTCTNSLIKVVSVGLGCVLIHRSVMKKIEFGSFIDENVFPDSLFYAFCQEKNIPVYLDSSLFCKHLNKDWSIQKSLTNA